MASLAATKKAAALGLILVCSTACTHRFVYARRPTCVVLSSGKAEALGQLGALRAVQDVGLEVDCVVGAGMGTVAGAIYAADPNRDPVDGYIELASRYDEVHGIGGLIIILLLDGWRIDDEFADLSGIPGKDPGHAQTEDSASHAWMTSGFASTLAQVLGGDELDRLALRLTTVYVATREHHVEIETWSEGSLSVGITRAIHGAVAYDVLDLVDRGRVPNPPPDEIAAVPVRAACQQFPGHRLLALNVTDEPAVRTRVPCPILEVRIDVEAPEVRPDVEAFLLGQSPEFQRAVSRGYDLTLAALRP